MARQIITREEHDAAGVPFVLTAHMIPFRHGRPTNAVDFEVANDWDRPTIAGICLPHLPKGHYYFDPATKIVTRRA